VDETQYENPDGTFSYYVPPGAVLVAATALQSKIAYAAIAQIDENETVMLPYEGARIPQIWFEKGEETRMFRLAARPIPVPADTTSLLAMNLKPTGFCWTRLSIPRFHPRLAVWHVPEALKPTSSLSAPGPMR
jgi:hypothetical protein